MPIEVPVNHALPCCVVIADPLEMATLVELVSDLESMIAISWAPDLEGKGAVVRIPESVHDVEFDRCVRVPDCCPHRPSVPNRHRLLGVADHCDSDAELNGQLRKDVRCLEVHHSGLVDHDLVAGAQHIVGCSPVDVLRRRINVAGREPAPHHRACVVRGPAIPMIEQQRVNTCRRASYFSRRHGGSLPRGSDHQHSLAAGC
ncbi:MAG: hypothetical protein ABS62_11145 [Microbacterium sp. SCN 70-200]|nr:MAG: hypothetical protein ABS62_11145 [Microbacterium sp. SCN 70-200]